MPYIYVDEIPEEVEEAQVVEQSEFDNLQNDYEIVIAQRDEAIGRAEVAEAALKESKQKYANAFLSTPARIDNDESGEKVNLTAQSIDSLFKIG